MSCTSSPFPATVSSDVHGEVVRLRLTVRGAVQGVGFRPFIYRLATELKLSGWVTNSPAGVVLEVEGPQEVLHQFQLRLGLEKPLRSDIQSLQSIWLTATGDPDFRIVASQQTGERTTWILPDIATCPDCRQELFDPQNRRYRYPFSNCTHCGPRFSIIDALPYDRANTSMKRFALCPDCQAEFENPRDRRFHAQPNACPACGPHLEFWDADGTPVFANHQALLAAAHAIRRGKIVAVKAVGGFHLLVDARDDTAVQRLRTRKQREEKPFALLFHSLRAIGISCDVSPLEARLLGSPAAPIVLLKKIVAAPPALSAAISPGNAEFGVMLPSNPLHHLLLAELQFPVVATSGNLSDEPICTDEGDALVRLRGIADAFLIHDRPIVRPEDDSIVRVMSGREMVLRRSRGYAPLPIRLAGSPADGRPSTVLAVGAHLKNAVALAVGEEVFLSQHIGDLETEQADDAFRGVAGDLPRLYQARPEVIAADLHPDYRSTQFAKNYQPLPPGSETAGSQGYKSGAAPSLVLVQHHVAHVLACMAENEIPLPALGVAWDGTGYGTDGTLWGGEFFAVANSGVRRLAHLRPFRLPGGDLAVKEPRRAALGLLYELHGPGIFQHRQLPEAAAFSTAEWSLAESMLARGLNSPWTSSIGRLFDAVASLSGLRQRMRFEGQAAMDLESAIGDVETDEAYLIQIDVTRESRDGSGWMLDWAPLIEAVLADVACGVSAGRISARFHNALVEAVVAVATRVGQPRVALGGGCFQNRYLTERLVARLQAEGFQPAWPQRVPPNDGGIAFGQVVAARWQLELK